MVSIDLAGKTAVVTGASSGMGAQVTRVMAACGARVLAVGRDADRLQATVNDVQAAGGEAVPILADLSDVAATVGVAERARSLASHIDVLVLAAGHFESGPIAETSAEQLDALWAVHVRAPFLLVRELLPALATGASVLFVSSTVAQAGFAPFAAYSAVKGAVEAMARSLAVELAPAVRVNVLAPGFTATPMMDRQFVAVPELEAAIVQRTPVGYMGGPEHVAHVAAFLASDLAGYVDGARLVVDGGWTAQAWQG